MTQSVFCGRDGALLVSSEAHVPGVILVGRGDAFVAAVKKVAEDRDGKLFIPGVASAHLDEEAGLLIACFAADVRSAMPAKMPVPEREAA